MRSLKDSILESALDTYPKINGCPFIVADSDKSRYQKNKKLFDIIADNYSAYLSTSKKYQSSIIVHNDDQIDARQEGARKNGYKKFCEGFMTSPEFEEMTKQLDDEFGKNSYTIGFVDAVCGVYVQLK